MSTWFTFYIIFVHLKYTSNFPAPNQNQDFRCGNVLKIFSLSIPLCCGRGHRWFADGHVSREWREDQPLPLGDLMAKVIVVRALFIIPRSSPKFFKLCIVFIMVYIYIKKINIYIHIMIYIYIYIRFMCIYYVYYILCKKKCVYINIYCIYIYLYTYVEILRIYIYTHT